MKIFLKNGRACDLQALIDYFAFRSVEIPYMKVYLNFQGWNYAWRLRFPFFK